MEDQDSVSNNKRNISQLSPIQLTQSNRNKSQFDLSNVPFQVVKYQPCADFQFLTTYGRKCIPAWFQKFKWMHYNMERDSIFCFKCVKACHLIGKSNDAWFHGIQTTFIIMGFKNWKKAAGSTGKLQAHENSDFHKKMCI